MFKIESYLAPLLMSYIDKYVKLRTEDFQLSLWGGDVVLNNLDLRLDVIEKAIQLPIIFKSGHIHELRLHVPWTKLRSEPVVITINTIECILKVRDTGYQESAKSTSSGHLLRSASQQKLKLKQKAAASELPPGYLQSLINKIVNNVNIVVNNLILKFVEDDIVLSINVKSAECYSVDKDWSRAFAELSPTDLVLRRVISFSDLTVCLDKSDASGKIDMYQDPVLYRSSVTCRLHMAFEAMHSKYISVTKVNIFCDKLDLTLTDTQLPMVIRLVQLCLAIYYGDIDMTGDEPLLQEVNRTDQPEPAHVPRQGTDVDGSVGWGEWAWSFVPQITAEDEEAESLQSSLKSLPKAAPIISCGAFIAKASVKFKLTESIRESIHYGPNKVSFKPLLLLESEGLGLEILAEGLKFLNVQCGITSLSVSGLGECVCGEDDSDITRSCRLLSGGSSLSEPRPVCYTTDSLFDPLGADNQGAIPDYVTDYETHMQTFRESFGLNKYGVFWMDFVYMFDLPESQHGSRSSTSGETEDLDNCKENSSLRLLVGPSTLNFSSSLYHRVSKFIFCAGNHHYEPFKKTNYAEPVSEDRGPPTDQQIQSLEEFIPTRSYHLTFVKPIINIISADHPQCNVKKKRRKTSKQKQKVPTSPSLSTSTSDTTLHSLPAVRLSADRFDLQMTSAMYAGKLVSIVSKMAGASSNLLHHCYSHTHIKLFSLQVGLTSIDVEGVSGPVVTILPSCSGALYQRSLITPHRWPSPHLVHVEWMYEAPSIVVSLTKPQLLLLRFVYDSWQEKNPQPSALQDNSLLQDAFIAPGVRPSNREPLLEATVTGLELKHCKTPVSFSATGTLTSLQAVLYANIDGRDSIIPIFTAPTKTSMFRTTDYFTTELTPSSPEIQEDWITFTFQLPSTPTTPEVPAVVLAEVGGVTACLDPSIYQWLLYSPRVRKSGSTKSTVEETKHFVDPTLANAASPLIQSQLSAHSQSSVKDRSESYQTPTNTQSPSKEQVQAAASSPAVLVSPAGQLPGTPGADNALPSNDSSSENGGNYWGRKCAQIFPVIRILQLQLNVSSVCIFLPKSPVIVCDAGMEIAENMRGVYNTGTLPDTLVVNLPNIRAYSCAFKPLSALQEIPILMLEGTLAGEKLPWTVQVSDISMYTLHKMKKAYSLVKPTDLSCTVAVSSKFTPPTSDTISSLGMCLHVDMTNVKLALSPAQTQTIAVLVSQISSVQRGLTGFWGRTSTLTPEKHSKTKPDHVSPPSFNSPVLEMSTSGAEAVTTETSEEHSRETTPSRELEIEEAHSSGVKLSFWLQWTLPKFEMALYGEDPVLRLERCVSVQLEELSVSIDIQEVYGKVKSKIGLANITHLVKRSGESTWQLGDYQGLLIVGPSPLPKNVHIISNKLWTTDAMPSPMGSLYTLSEAVSRDNNHGLLSFTFTRALCKNVKRRMRRLNVEMAGLHEPSNATLQEMLSNNYQKYVSEVCFSIEPCDVVVHRPVLTLLLSLLNVNVPRDSLNIKGGNHWGNRVPLNIVRNPAHISDTKSKSSTESDQRIKKKPSISSASLPLLYVNVSNLRIFLPVAIETSDKDGDAGSTEASTFPGKVERMVSSLDHDLFILQLTSLSINPQADNPLPRPVLEKEVYRRALDAGITQHPGSQLEDRQYQLDIKGLTFCSGLWSDFERCLTRQSLLETSRQSTVQIPAVEWNNLISPNQKEKDIRVIPLASRFDLKVVMAPAIVYNPPSDIPSLVKQCIVVCGHAVEVNITSDLDFYISNFQINLLHKMVKQHLSAPVANRNKMAASNKDSSRTEFHPSDSGVESDASTINTNSQIPFDGRNVVSPPPVFSPPTKESVTITTKPVSGEITPVDILLTAGRMTFVMYSHKLQTEVTNKFAGKKKKFGNAKSKRNDREKKSGRYNGKKGSYRQPWNTCGYLADESSDEFEGTYDPSAHLRFLSLHPQVERRASLEDDRGVVLIPFLYSYFSQPHAVLSVQADGQKLEMSCYDLLLKGASIDHWIKVTDSKVIPDCSDYSVHWLETRAGCPNLKTGVPPSLITVRITDLLQGPAGVYVELERPVRLSTTLTNTQQINLFMEDTVATWWPKEEERADNPPASKDQPQKKGKEQESALLSILTERIKSFELQTEQIILHGRTFFDDQDPFVLLVLGSVFTDAVIHLDDAGKLAEIVGSLYTKDVLVKTGFENKSRTLIGPFTNNLDCMIQWCENSGSSWQPKVTIVMDMGLVSIEIGQEHLMCLEMIPDHLAEFKQMNDVEQLEKSSQAVEVDTVAPAKSSKPFVVHSSKDDLKSGAFQYIVEEGENLNPNPGEIVFGVEVEGGEDTMTWSYHQPRVISHFYVSPVPFNVSADGSSDSLLVTKIPCLLQYWDVMSRQFINFSEFFLSENLPCEISLPEVRSHVTCLTAALMWRVVISRHLASDSDSEDQASTSSQTQSPSVVLPMSLAACIKVDSCFVPSVIPTLQLSLSTSIVEIHLSTHLQHLGEEMPTKFVPFLVDTAAVPNDQEFATVTLSNLGVIASRVQGLQPRITAQMSALCQLDVVEYKFLTKQTVVKPTSCHSNISIDQDKQDLIVECGVNVDPVTVRMGKGVTHTLNCASQAWAQMLSDSVCEPSPRIVFNHYTVCNDTQNNIRFGQVGTDENIYLMSREMSLYSWRTASLPQCLHLCLDGMKWQWSEPFSIGQPGVIVRRVTTPDQTYTVILRVKQVSNIHTQVVITGNLVVSSRLSQLMELKLTTGEADTKLSETSAVIAGGQTAPSWVVEETHMRSVRLRLTNMKTLWSQEVFISGERMTENRLVKIPLNDGTRSIHVWCRILHQNLGATTQTLVLLSPLYIVRSHLPHPLFLNLETQRLKTSCQLEAPSRGRELEIHCMGGDLCHSLSFQLGRSLPKSSPPVTLSTGLVEQITRSKLETVDIPGLCYDWKVDYSYDWPYTTVDKHSSTAQSAPSPKDFQKRNVSTVAPDHEAMDGSSYQPNVDLNVSLLEYWPGFNTLLITVTPFCLLGNQSGLDLVVFTSTDTSDVEHFDILNGCTLAPQKFQDGLRLGVKDDEGLAVSSPITLSDEEWSVRRHHDDTSKHTLFTDSFVHITIPTVQNGHRQVCLLTLKAKLEHGMKILTIGEQVSVCNLLPSTRLSVTSYTIPLGGRVSLPSDESLVSETVIERDKFKPTTSPLLFWRVVSGEVTVNENPSFVQYLRLKDVTEGDAEPSCPVRVISTENGTRSSVTVPKATNTDSHVHTRPLVVTGHNKGGITYLVIQEDKAPACVIHNKCSFPLVFGQTLLNLSSSDFTVQEETELCRSLPIVQPYRNAHYTLPYLNSKFPEIHSAESGPSIHLAISSTDSKSRNWTSGIDPSVETDRIFSIPNGPDLKVHVEKVSMVTHVVVETVSKADISAKEIRSRIKGHEKTVLVPTEKRSPKPIETVAPEVQKVSVEPTLSRLKDSETVSSRNSDSPNSIKNTQAKTHSWETVNLSLGLFFKQFSFVLLDETSSVESIGEVLRLTIDDGYLAYYPASVSSPRQQGLPPAKKYCVSVCAGDIQIDNQCFSKGQFDFPVTLIKQNRTRESFRFFGPEFFSLSVIEKHAFLKGDSLLHVQLVSASTPFSPGLVNETLEASLQPLCVYVDDSFIHRILHEVELLIPVHFPAETFRTNPIRALPISILIASCNGASPVAFRHFSIQPIKLLLSVHASLKVFIASDQTPLTFGKFERHQVFTTGYQLTKALVMHYVSGAIFRAGLVVGSLDVLGNPTGLVRSVGNGVADLFRLPYAGLTRSPGAFVSGISNGMSSFLRNISAGTISSITNFAASVSRNMDRLSLDKDHSQRQEENRRTRPDGLSSGIRQGLTGFGLSLLGAVAGLADQPIQGALQNEVRVSTTATGIVSGVGKGLMGVVTKPIGGAAEFVSQTGQGFLHSTGLVRLAEQRSAPVSELWAKMTNSRVKNVWKLLSSLPPGNSLLMELPAVQFDAGGFPVRVTLLLTTDIVFVINCEEDNQEQAFTAIELECVDRVTEPNIITLIWTDSFQKAIQQECSTDRVAEFVDKSSSYVCLSGVNTTVQDPSVPISPALSADSDNPSTPPPLQFHVNPYYKESFMTWLNFTKRQLHGQGFVF